jgi:hypothetical protein
MITNRSFVEQNKNSRDRMNGLVNKLSEEELKTIIGEKWTISVIFAHLAFWDERMNYVLDETEREGKLIFHDMDIVVNDILFKLFSSIPPMDAVRIALETAKTLDDRLEKCSDKIIDEIAAYNKRLLFRAIHRTGHLNEIETELAKRS